MHRLPQCHENRKLNTKTYIKELNRIPHCHHGYPHARHTSSDLKSNIQSNITKPQRARLNSSQQDREREETPYDPTILMKLVIHQDRAKSRTRERERDQTHSYWCIPSAPRVNYSLLVMETAGMMKMVSGDGFPLWQGARTGSRLVFHGYRGLRWRNSRFRFLSGGYGIYKSIWHWKQVRGHPRGPQALGARPGGGRAPWLMASLVTPWHSSGAPWVSSGP
jgi:hypothetical protein